MKHKMIGCSEECLEFACCDFCMYAHHEFFFDKDGDIVCGCCPDFHCFRADEDNMVVKEIDDDAMA